ncbi:hypothetical protein Tco_0649037, partial [Tanacetum coccineum]
MRHEVLRIHWGYSFGESCIKDLESLHLGVPKQEPVYGDEEADIQRAVELSIKEQAYRTQGPAHPVVIRDPNFGRIQPLPGVQGKRKEKVSDEQVALNLL